MELKRAGGLFSYVTDRGEEKTAIMKLDGSWHEVDSKAIRVSAVQDFLNERLQDLRDRETAVVKARAAAVATAPKPVAPVQK